MAAYDVHVYIYDLSRGVARAMSPVFLGKQIDGIWHTGIVVYGQEFFFGGTGGIESCPPGGTILGQPDTKHFLGQTHIPYDMFIDYLGDLAQTSYRPDKYHLLDHNCNTFSSEIAQFLTGNDIPSNITGLPAEVMSTPFGQMIRPMIDAMSVQPSGGHALFPQTDPSVPHGVKSTLAGAKPSQPTPAPTQAAPASSQSEAQGAKVEQKLEPVIFKQQFHDMIWRRPELNISGREQGLITDLQDYIHQMNPSWAPGRDHLAVLRRLIQDSDDRCELCALEMLTSLVTKEDIIQLLNHDPKNLILEILQLYDNYTFNRKEAVIKMMANCCSSDAGSKLVLCEETRQLTTKICVACLLGDNLDLTRPAISLCFNMAMREVQDDMELEIGSALLNCVDREFEDEAAYQLLTALLTIIQRNEEVKGLASVIGLNLEVMQKIKSDRVTSLCDKIMALL